MKPWEEAWTTEGHCDEVRTADEPRQARLQSTAITEGDTSNDDVAKLAAQAPAMARLLLKLQHVDFDDCHACPVCQWTVSVRGHATDCELAAVLRAAGVLP